MPEREAVSSAGLQAENENNKQIIKIREITFFKKSASFVVLFNFTRFPAFFQPNLKKELRNREIWYIINEKKHLETEDFL